MNIRESAPLRGDAGGLGGGDERPRKQILSRDPIDGPLEPFVGWRRRIESFCLGGCERRALKKIHNDAEGLFERR